MYYYNPDKRTGRVAASIATLLYFLTLGALFLLVKFTLPEEPELGNGMLIDFGTVAEAGGASDPSVSEVDQQSTSQPSSTPQPIEPQLTSDDEEAPEIAQQQKTQKPQPTQTQQQAKKPTEQTQPARTADPRKSFKMSSPSSGTSNSQGETSGTGDQGSQDGAQGGTATGLGAGNMGISLDMGGRGFDGNAIRPEFVNMGHNRVTIIIEITADSEGNIKTARLHRTTEHNQALIEEARRAALKTKLSKAEAELQRGYITYIFIPN